MLNGLQTNPDIPGTEKLVIIGVQDKWLLEPRVFISCNDFDVEEKGLVPPQSIFCVKGWNRSICALLVLLAAFELAPLMEAG